MKFVHGPFLLLCIPIQSQSVEESCARTDMQYVHRRPARKSATTKTYTLFFFHVSSPPSTTATAGTTTVPSVSIVLPLLTCSVSNLNGKHFYVLLILAIHYGAVCSYSSCLFLLAKSYFYHSPIHTLPLHTHTLSLSPSFFKGQFCVQAYQDVAVDAACKHYYTGVVTIDDSIRINIYIHMYHC